MKKSKMNAHTVKANEKGSNSKADAMNKMLSKMHHQSLELALAHSKPSGVKNQRSSDFNINTLTRLNQENCEVNTLNECKVLAKYSANIFNAELSEKSCTKSKPPGPVQVANGGTSVDLEPSNRKVVDDQDTDIEFGDEIVDALDGYLSNRPFTCLALISPGSTLSRVFCSIVLKGNVEVITSSISRA